MIDKQLRAAARQVIAAGGATQSELAAAAGIPQPRLSVFLTGRGTLRLDSAAKLAAALGLELRPVDKRGAGG